MRPRDAAAVRATWPDETEDAHLVVGDLGPSLGRDKVEELAEQKAQERLQALRAEHGIPAP